MKPFASIISSSLFIIGILLFQVTGLSAQMVSSDAEVAAPALENAASNAQCLCKGHAQVLLGEVRRTGFDNRHMEDCRSLMNQAGFSIVEAPLNYITVFKNFPQDNFTMNCFYLETASFSFPASGADACIAESYRSGNRMKNPYAWESRLSMLRDVSCTALSS